MKSILNPTCHLALALVAAPCVFGQGTAFTYQGRLDSAGNPASGSYDFRFKLYLDPIGNTQFGTSFLTNGISVSGGLFTVPIDFGAGVFSGTSYWLEVDVRTNGAGSYTVLAPLQALTPSPYAIMAGSASNLLGTLPAAQLSGTYGNAVTFTNGANTFSGTFSGSFTGSGSGLADVWHTGGNLGTTAATNFLGTTDNQPLELHVNATRVLRLEPDSRGLSAGNLIGGFISNAVAQPGSGGDVIAGGGWSGGANLIYANSSGVFIGAGSVNSVGPNVSDSVIVGGYANTVQSSDSAIVGGYANTIQAGGSAIGGGYLNTNGGRYSTIAGGSNNLVTVSATNATIGGGTLNTASGDGATVSGGIGNASGDYAVVPGGASNTAIGAYSFAAGQQAQALQPGAFVWADSQNLPFSSTATNQFSIRANGGVRINDDTSMSFGATPRQMLDLWATSYAIGIQDYCLYFRADTLGNFAWFNGGTFTNTKFDPGPGGIKSMSLDSSGNLAVRGAVTANNLMVNGLSIQQNANGAPNVIGGSPVNFVAGSTVGATIGGGGATNFAGNVYSNSVTGNFGTVGGGRQNTASGFASTVAGGDSNMASTNSATVGGGYGNTASGQWATVAGGIQNTASVSYATVAGGVQNTASNLESTVGGGYNNTASGSYATVAGGSQNTAGGTYATVGGGFHNMATNDYATVAGGSQNTANNYGTVSGGYTNTASNYGAVGGGFDNAAGGFATVAGGYGNTASANYSFAAGQLARALHQGAFVWADSQNTNFASATNDEFSIRARGGVRISSGVGVHLNGATGPIVVRDYDPFAANATEGKAGLGRWGMFIEPSTLTLGIPGSDAGVRYFQVVTYDIGGAPTPEMQVDQSGNVLARGTVTANNMSFGSDRNVKENFRPLDAQILLAKVAALPISEWNYKDDATRKKHVGPMAQDFHAAFGLNGDDDRHISVVDEGGVALAAIQGLNQKLEQKETEITELKAQLNELKDLVRAMNHKPN